MKKLIATLVTAFVLTVVQGQDRDSYIGLSTGIDIRNAIVGSAPTDNKSAADLNLILSLVSKNWEVTAGYEHFEKINFSKYSIGVGYRFPLYCYIGNKQVRTTVAPSIEYNIINRWDKWGNSLSYDEPSSHLAPSASLRIHWELGERLGLGLLLNAQVRADLGAKYPNTSWHQKATAFNSPVVGSTFLVISYKLKKYF
jgi:hypothetical protein